MIPKGDKVWIPCLFSGIMFISLHPVYFIALYLDELLYGVLDKLLYEYIEHRKGPLKLAAMGFDEALVKKVLRLVNSSEYKRFQTPPILRVSPKAFGMGRRLPIVGKYLS